VKRMRIFNFNKNEFIKQRFYMKKKGIKIG